MIKRFRAITIFILIVAILILLLGRCSGRKQAGEVLPPEIKAQPHISRYTIDVRLNPEEKTLTAEQQITYPNNENVELNELFFHVYPNAFKRKETAPFLFDDFNRAYNEGFQPGYIAVASVELSDEENRAALDFSLQGEGETILKVALPKALKPNNSITLNMKYKIVIPPAGERFGYGDGNFNLGNWYPVAAVYDNTGWNLDKYYAVGDPFYSDASDYTVSITAPKEYTVAASGSLTEERVEGDNKVWKFEAKNMRDFAFVANNRFKIAEDTADGIKIRSYYYEGQEKKGKAALEYAQKAIEVFNGKFGKYPYPEYSVVETEFPSGMEYPGLVYINQDYYEEGSNEESLIFTTVHETAHQWWYGVVGNDQIDEAWLDEGFATYSEVVFVESEYGKTSGEKYMEYIESNAEEAVSSRVFDGVILKPLSEYKNWQDYGPAVYNGGASLLNALRKQVGDEVFFNILKTYYRDYGFKNATTEDFLNVCEKVGNKDFDGLFDKHLTMKQ